MTGYRFLTAAVALCAVLLMRAPAPAVAQDLNLPQISPAGSVTQTIGVTDMSIAYSRPGVKGRTIWGELVPYGEIWRTGANEATKFTVSDDIKVQGKPLPAGVYAVFTLPTETTWTVIFNKGAEQWGAFSHDPEKDVLRVEVTPQKMNTNQEWMGFEFANLSSTSGELALRWEKLRVPVEIEVSLDKVVAEVREAMTKYDGEGWQTPYRCASFLFTNGLEMEQAEKWAAMSVKKEETFFNTRLMAEMMAKKGDHKKAVAYGKKAIELGKKRENPIDTRPVERMVAQWQGGS